MASESHYKCNLRDIYFNLFEMNPMKDEICGKAPYEHMDVETAKELLQSTLDVVMDKYSTSYADGDRIPLKLDSEGNVTLPASMTDAMKTFMEAGLHLMDVPEEVGGIGAPRSLYWASFEMQAGANAPLGFYLFGSNSIEMINNYGSEDQKKRYCKSMLEQNWMTTMVLTEENAGSDVGAGRATAKDMGDGTWQIEGVKRFITNGDFDAVPNILHFTLARPEGAEAGTKGLSMFMVPKYWVNEDGSMGERNGVRVSNLEEKMGIKGSSTCELTYGEDKPARGLLFGEVHEGIKQMFRIIERARMAVGTKSMSHLSTAYLHALEYCKERVQGPDLKEAMDKTAEKVTIVHHPDVRRMLMVQKSLAEGLRGLTYHCAHLQDKMEVAKKANDPEGVLLHKKLDILLPMLKGYASERVYEVLGQSLQCFGGSGYLKDYPIEQYIRDQKIDSLYEGTTHIQALDLIFRKVARDGGETLTSMTKEIYETSKAKKAGSALEVEYAALKTALDDNQTIRMTMMQKRGESIYFAGLNGNRILNALTEMFLGWLLVQQAEVALDKMESATADDKAFYEGKLANARFWCTQVIPNISLAKDLVAKSDLSLMEMREEAF